MPTARVPSRRTAAAEPSCRASSSRSSSLLPNGAPSAPEDHLLTYVNNMRHCCDMSLFYSNFDEYGTNFIADSIAHATQIFAKYATASRSMASPSKLAGELLKSPTRTRTRSKAAPTRKAGASDLPGSHPFAESIDITDKENGPSPTRTIRVRAEKPSVFATTTDKGKNKATDNAVAPKSRSLRKVLGDANANRASVDPLATPSEPTKQKKTDTSQAAAGSRTHSVQEDESMALDATDSYCGAEQHVPRASTPPRSEAFNKRVEKTETSRTMSSVDELEIISLVDSESDDEGLHHAQKAAASRADATYTGMSEAVQNEPQVASASEREDATSMPSQAAETSLVTVSENADKDDDFDQTPSSTEADAKLEKVQQAAAALLASKLHLQKDTISEKPVKRTLASYGAKKSLPASSNQSRHSNAATTIHPASTPAGPGFRSSFLNKSLRKQIADQQAQEESDDDSDTDSDNDNDDATGRHSESSAQTEANTRTNATLASRSASTSISSRKRKSEDSHELIAPTCSDVTSLPPPQKMTKSKDTAVFKPAKPAAGLATNTSPMRKGLASTGPVSKLEQFRNNLAHVSRSTGSGSSAPSIKPSQTSTPTATSLSSTSMAAPDREIKSVPASNTGVPTKLPTDSASSDSSAELTERLNGNKSGESTIKASAIPRSPMRSPTRAAASVAAAALATSTSPVRPPPRTGSVRKSPRKLQQQLEKEQQLTTVRAASPSKTRAGVSSTQAGSAGTTIRAPTSPVNQPRSLAALFGSPKQASKLPTLAGSTTPANSPPKGLQLGRVPFPRASTMQTEATAPQDKSLPQTPVEERSLASVTESDKEFESKKVEAAQKMHEAATTSGGVRPDPKRSASDSVRSISNDARESKFFDARSRENTPEQGSVAKSPNDKAGGDIMVNTIEPLELPKVKSPTKATSKPAQAVAVAVAPAPTKSGVTKASGLSPKKVAAKALSKAQPTSPSKAGSVRGAIMSGSPSKSKTSSLRANTALSSAGTAAAASSTSAPAPPSPSRTWGLGEKIKGFLGLHASTTNSSTTSTAQTKISASGTFQPRSRTASVSVVPSAPVTQAAAVVAPFSSSSSSTASAAPPVDPKPMNIPGALLASPPPASKVPTAVHSTPSSASMVGGKPASLARAELLRKKQAEEEERKTKEKEERRKVLLAKKEERARAAAEEELEKESKKRARGHGGADNAPAAIPAALLGGIAIGAAAAANTSVNGTSSSRISTVSSASSGGPPTRPSSAMNGSYASVKSRYMQSANAAASLQQQPQQPQEANKKRRLTADKDGSAVVIVGGGAAAGPVPGQSQQMARQPVTGAPKLTRTISQSSIRPPSSQPSSSSNTASSSQPPQQIKIPMKPPGSAVAGFGAAPRVPAAMVPGASSLLGGKPMGVAAPTASQAPRAMANANFSSSNPFQQAKQQQLQMQMQKQKQLQMQQQQQQQQQAVAAAAAMREQELHRAAQMQIQMQNAAGGRFDEYEQDAGEAGGGVEEPLPDIASEYSDSEDEETIQKRAAMPLWTQGDALDAALLAQSTVDADEIFGIPQGPVELEKILPGERTLNRIRRPRTSSANWSGQDGLAQWEIDRYNKRMGIKGAGVILNRDGSHPPPPPPGASRRD